MALNKNTGPPLTSTGRGSVDNFPREFLAKIGIRTISRQVPVDIEPKDLTLLLVESKLTQERTDERKLADTYLLEPPNENPLLSEVKLDSGLVGSRTRQLVPDPTDLDPLVGCLTESADQVNLGNGWLDQTVVQAPSLFTRAAFRRTRPDVTPPDFGALLETDEVSVTACGTASDPTLGDQDLSATDEQLDVWKHRTTRATLDNLELPQFFINKKTNEVKQIVQETRFLLDATTTPAVPTALRDVTFTKLGDGTALEVVDDVDSVFAHAIYTRERGVVTPEDFRALLQVTSVTGTLIGTAVAPSPLPTGRISVTDEQVDVFSHRETVRLIDVTTLPQTNVNKRTNRFKQVETVTRILEDATTVPAVPTALRDVTFTKLGDGTALEEQVTIPSVFVNRTSSKELPDLIPDIFKALLPTIGSETTFAGTIAVPPVLDTGDFFKSETQVDEFTKRIVTRGRAGVSLPQDVTILRHLGGFEFGGERTKLTGYLNDSAPSVEEGLGIVSSEVKDLGNGTFFRQTEKWDVATEWPELTGTEVDPRTGIVVTVLRKVVAAGTTGGVVGDTYTDVKPIDKWRSIQIASALDLDSLPDQRTWETTIEHAFPNTLNSAFWLWARALAPHAYDFDTSLLLDITQGYAGPCRALVTESFTQGPPLDAVSITQFFPQAYTVGFAWAYADDVTLDEDCGDCFGIARANSRTWPIPPTLHGAITIGGGVVVSGGGITNTIPATNPVGLPASGTLITKAVDVDPWRFNIFYRRMVQIYVP